MVDGINLDLPWKEVVEWDRLTFRNCKKAIDACLEIHGGDEWKCFVPFGEVHVNNAHAEDAVSELNEFDAEDALSRWLDKKATCKYFATPDSQEVRIFSTTDLTARQHKTSWGRSVYHHIDSISRGLNALEERDSSPEVSRHASIMRYIGGRFGATFPRNYIAMDELKSAALNKKDHNLIARYGVTFIDVTLCSALLHLMEIGRAPEDNSLKPLEEYLVAAIKRELELHVSAVEQSRPSPIADEANVWWGHCELMRREGDSYSINGYHGLEGAIAVTELLINDRENRPLLTPSFDRTLLEIPFGCYDLTRTRLLVLMNCINIYKTLPENIKSVVAKKISSFANWLFNEIKTADIASMYQLGIALQVSNLTLSLQDEKELGGNPLENGKPLSAKALGNQMFRIRYENNKHLDIPVMNNPGKVLEALIVLGGAAREKDLNRLAEISTAGRDLRTAKTEFGPLGKFIKLSGPKKLGYRTEIEENGLREREYWKRRIEETGRNEAQR